jgi:DNA-binding MltR family transcriptional regulator
MASRRDSLQKLDKNLRDLMRRVPDGKELFQILFGISDDRPHANLIQLKAADRMVAITAAAFLDHALQRAICTHFPLSSPDKSLKELFGDRGPLGNTSAKIIMAHSLDIINTEEREDLDTIRAIRNSFAHSLVPIGFDLNEVKALCETLRLPYNMEQNITPTPRERFSTRVTILFYILFKYDQKKSGGKSPTAAPTKPLRDKLK